MRTHHLVATWVCCYGLFLRDGVASDAVSGDDEAVQITVKSEMGAEVSSFEWSLNECKATSHSEVVFPWNGLAYTVVLTCNADRLLKVGIREWTPLAKNGPAFHIYETTFLPDTGLLLSSARFASSASKKEPFTIEVQE